MCGIILFYLKFRNPPNSSLFGGAPRAQKSRSLLVGDRAVKASLYLGLYYVRISLANQSFPLPRPVLCQNIACKSKLPSISACIMSEYRLQKCNALRLRTGLSFCFSGSFNLTFPKLPVHKPRIRSVLVVSSEYIKFALIIIFITLRC